MQSIDRHTHLSLCDLFVLFFAVWTIACNLTVFLEGPIFQAIFTFGAIAIALIFWLRRTNAAHHSICNDISAHSTTDNPSNIQNIQSAAPETQRNLTPLQLVVFAVIVLFTVAAAVCFVNNYIVIGWLCCLACYALALIPGGSPPTETVSPQDAPLPKSLWIVAIVMAILTLCTHRWNDDDTFYVNVAIQIVDYPTLPLFKHDLYLHIPDAPIFDGTRKVVSFEALAGVISLASGIPAIYVLHLIIPGIAAVLTVFAYGHLYQVLAPKNIIWAVLGALIFLCANGQTHESFGNHTFPRLFQGKAIMTAAMTPLIMTYGLRFSIRPDNRNWILLAAAQIASVGLTGTALWFAPSVAGFALIAGMSSMKWPSIKTTLIGLSSSSYIVCIGIYLLKTIKFSPLLKGTLGADGIHRDDWQSLFNSLIKNPFGDHPIGLHSFSFVMLLILTSTWYFTKSKLSKRFSMLFPLGILLSYINPFLIEYIADYVTSGMTYYRSAWLLPIPALAGLLFMVPLTSQSNSRPSRNTLVYGMVLMMLLFTQRHIFSKSNRAQMGWPTIKVNGAYPVAKVLNEISGKATIIAPRSVAVWVTTFHHHARPIMVTKPDYWPMYAVHIGKEEALYRQNLTMFVQGEYQPQPYDPHFFENGLEKYNVKTVCLPLFRYPPLRNNQNAAPIVRSLKRKGFHLHSKMSGYQLWLRN